MESVLQKVVDDKINFISLQFTDLMGVIKEIVIPSEQLEGAIKNGVWFDGSSIEGFARIQESDLFLKPDTETYAIIPWLAENGRTARLICDIHKPDGTPFEGDPRNVLKRICSETDMEFNVGPEPEFYFFRDGKAMDSGSYFDMTSHEGYTVIKEIMKALEHFGIDVETSHHEVGNSQYEIDFKYGPALKIADNLLTLKYTVKKIAQMHGIEATFMPKPAMGIAGSGLHIHQSLFKDGKNLFYDENDKYNLSKIAYNFIAGQMKNIKPMCAILCPIVNSYKRLVSGFEAPVYITWAAMNRSSLIRIPKWFNQKSESARIELRCPDPSSNPYLAFAVMLKAGLEGIKNNLSPPEPVEENVYDFDEKILIDKKIETLPSSLFEAITEMEKSEMMKNAFGNELFEIYLKIKNREWDEFKTQVTSWERKKFMGIY